MVLCPLVTGSVNNAIILIGQRPLILLSPTSIGHRGVFIFLLLCDFWEDELEDFI